MTTAVDTDGRRRRAAGCGVSALLHILTASVVISSVGPQPSQTRRAPPSMAAFIVAPTEDAEFSGLKPIDRTRPEWMLDDVPEAATVAIDRYRFDIAKISNRATLLFPFLTPGLSLEHFGVEATPQSWAFHNPVEPKGPREASAMRQPALALSDLALQRLIDRTWSRRDRWTPFQRIVELTKAYSPDDGRMPEVLRAYAERDGLQPYADTTVRDPRLWVELELAADHVQFIGFIRQYTSQHPRTRAATELLFLLDQMVQGSLDALLTLLTIEPDRDLQLTRETDAQAYALIGSLRTYYNNQLKRRGVQSTETARAYFEAIRLAILSRIISTTPDRYRANDAHYLVGTILWRQRRTADAMSEWAQIQVTPTDTYRVASSDIQNAMRSDRAAAGDAGGATLATRIRWILEAERGRWIAFSYERLRQFGYHVNTF